MQELNGLPKIPPPWSWSTINDVCLKVQDGTHFSPQNQLAQGAYKYITAKNVRPSGLDLSNVSYLAEDEHRVIYKRCDPKKGDVLLVKDGVNTGDAAVNTLDEEFSLLSSVCLLRPRPALLCSQFLRYYLLSPVGYRMLTGQMTGTAIKRIILGRIKGSPVPIAPLDEQRDIVAEIERQFSRLDEVVANLKRVKANLKRYKAAVLKAAVEGKLTEAWRKQHPDVEPASKLLERILVGTRPMDRRKEVELLDASSLEGLPEGWQWVRVGDVGYVQLGRQRAPKYHSGKNMRPYLRVQNVFEARIDLSDVMEMDFPQGDYKKFKLESGDILLNEGQSPELLGRPAIYRGELPGACFTNTLIRFQPYAPLTSEYPLIVFLAYMRTGRFTREGTITTNIAHLSSGRFAKIEFPLPPLEEQQEIVNEVARSLSVIEELEDSVEANLTRADRLRQSILTRAFEGKLIATKQPQRSDSLGELPLAAEPSSFYGVT